jgi:outer membrane phospholipase A
MRKGRELNVIGVGIIYRRNPDCVSVQWVPYASRPQNFLNIFDQFSAFRMNFYSPSEIFISWRTYEALSTGAMNHFVNCGHLHPDFWEGRTTLSTRSWTSGRLWAVNKSKKFRMSGRR